MQWLGFCYEKGEYGIQKNDLKAFEWYMKSAEKGDGYSKFKVGSIYARGGLNIKKDFKKAKYWLKKASVKDDYSGMKAKNFISK